MATKKQTHILMSLYTEQAEWHDLVEYKREYLATPFIPFPTPTDAVDDILETLDYIILTQDKIEFVKQIVDNLDRLMLEIDNG